MEINHLFFAYDKNMVIKDLNLKIEKNKITTLLGANGCGKSTLLKLITRVEKPKMGFISLDGKNIKNIERKEFAKKVAIVRQKNQIAGDIKVEELVAYGRNPYVGFMQKPSQEDKNKIKEAIEVCGLEEIRKERVNSLSGGQVQRAWIAMAIAQDSEILLLDEPTTYLDIKYQIEILKLIRNLNKNLGKTIIMVLHDINQSLEYSDTIVGMMKGKIEFQGKASQVLTGEKISKIYDTKLKIIDIENKKYVFAEDWGGKVKGLIIYSSKTGNTKRMAEKIYEVLKDEHQMTIKDIRDAPEVEQFDFILLGAWIDRGTLETKTLKFLKTIENKKLGLFATLGAMPDSEHGRKVIKNLENLLIDRDSLGQYICPGLVDPKMIEKLRGITGLVVPKKIKEKMIETSLASREASEEELEEAANYFYEKLINL